MGNIVINFLQKKAEEYCPTPLPIETPSQFPWLKSLSDFLGYSTPPIIPEETAFCQNLKSIIKNPIVIHTTDATVELLEKVVITAALAITVISFAILVDKYIASRKEEGSNPTVKEDTQRKGYDQLVSKYDIKIEFNSNNQLVSVNTNQIVNESDEKKLIKYFEDHFDIAGKLIWTINADIIKE